MQHAHNEPIIKQLRWYTSNPSARGV